jgi:hypothetical protein
MTSLGATAARVHSDVIWTDVGAGFSERAAILEFDREMPRHEAEAQALAEIYAAIMNEGRTCRGILGELITAARHRLVPASDDALRRLGIATCRAPLWGIDHIVPEGEGYRLADRLEIGDAAFVVPAFEHGGLVDLVAETIVPCSRYTRLGGPQWSISMPSMRLVTPASFSWSSRE